MRIIPAGGRSWARCMPMMYAPFPTFEAITALGDSAFAVRENTDAFAQFGLRYTSGMSAVDDLNGTGLDTINDHSARWAVPLSIGVRLRF